MKYLKTYESFEDKNLLKLVEDDAALFECYRVLNAMSPEFVTNIKLEEGNDFDNVEVVISFERTDVVTKEENEHHAGEHWKFALGRYDGDIEIVCENSGDNEPVDDIDDMISYALGDKRKIIWEILIRIDSRYKVECPADILKSLNEPLADAKNVGIFDR